MSKELMEKIYADHHRDAYLWCKQCVGHSISNIGHSEDHAKDILQTVYLKVLSGKAKFSGKSSLKTWLFAIIKYTAMDHFKKQKIQEPLEVTYNVAADNSESQLDNEYYSNILKRLTDKQAQVLLLVFYHDYTLEAASEVMGISIGTARTHYDRGKKKLKKILEQENKTTYDYTG